MKWYWWIFGIVEVCSFFYFSNLLTKEWSGLSARRFTKNIFYLSLTIRAVYVIFTYFFYVSVNGSYFEFGAADSYTYHIFATEGAEMIKNGRFNFLQHFNTLVTNRSGVDESDMGYPIYLSFIYLLSGNSVIAARMMKALFSSVSVILMYRIARRNFDESVGRMTAVFCALMPNLIFYCGNHLKETEMLFLVILFIDQADILLKRGRLDPVQTAKVLLIAFVSYFFRWVLPVVLILAVVTALVLGSSKLKARYKGLFSGLVFMVLVGASIWNIANDYFSLDVLDEIQEQQVENMSWRAERDNGNQFAQYASAAVFAPLIFTIPFPTMVETPDQEGLRMIHGGNYVKNITSFFTLFALIVLLMTGTWKDKTMVVAFLLGYLIVLVFSNYAQSERFHIPALPFELMFAAYGVSLMKNKQKSWYDIWLAFIFVANLGWAWFKLRGRGM